MPRFVVRAKPAAPGSAAAPEALTAPRRAIPPTADEFVAELVPRNCRLQTYTKVAVPTVKVDDEIIAYCSPDSTYAVTRRLFDAAERSILIGIYDLSAPHVKELLLDALGRGVTIKLMLDIDGNSEQTLFDELVSLGVDGAPAPSCASQHDAKFFRSSHEKVIIVDDEWCLVQSGNYSANSIPLNVVDGGDADHFRTGNRDTGLAIRSRKLAKFFSKLLESDIALELNTPEALTDLASAMDEVFLVEAAPTRLPQKLFPSRTFALSSPLILQPVLSPDNYMDVMPDKLAAARKSILIEQQYIRGSQDLIDDLLASIAAARDAAPGLDVRILLGKLFSSGEIPKEKKNLKLLADKYKLRLGRNIRFVDETRFVHCHNKMVLIDGKGVLVSSQNWSKAAVSENREAGVWLEHKGICKYFTAIFESDWKVGKKTLPEPGGPEIVGPESLRNGGFVQVAPADYREV